MTDVSMTFNALMEDPWNPAVMESALPVLRENPVLTIDLATETLKNDDPTPSAKAASMLLLADLDAPDGLNAVLDFYVARGNMAEVDFNLQDEFLDDFAGNIYSELLDTLYHGNVDRQIELVKDPSVDQLVREALLYHIVRAGLRKDMEKDQLHDLLVQMYEDNKDDLMLPSVLRSMYCSEMEDLQEIARKDWAQYEKQGYGTMEENRMWPASWIEQIPRVHYEDRADECGRMDAHLQEMIGGQQTMADLMESGFDPNMEALLNQLDSMPENEVLPFLQQNPAMAKELLTYINRNRKPTNLLKNKKSTTQEVDLSQYKSKKKKPGGKKAAKKKAKKGGKGKK